MVKKQSNTGGISPIISSLFLIILFGLIMLASASSVIGFTNFDDTYFYLKNQLLKGLLPGLFLLFLATKINYNFWRKHAVWIFLFCLLLLVLVFVPGLGFEYSNARSWLNLGIITIQPAEIAKLGLIIYLAAWLKKIGPQIKNFFSGTFLMLVISALIIGLVVLQPDIGTALILSVIVLSMFLAAGGKWSHFLIIIIIAGLLFGLMILMAPYRINRIMAFLDPASDTQGISYHVNQSLIAVGSGGWTGLGLGKSRQKFEYLPEVAGDSIFAIMAEEVGFVFSLGFIILFFFFIYKLLQSAKHLNDPFAKLFAVGLAGWIGFQALFNIGAMLNILPLTGVPLPFISYGGTSLAVLLAAIGILINMHKNA